MFMCRLSPAAFRDGLLFAVSTTNLLATRVISRPEAQALGRAEHLAVPAGDVQVGTPARQRPEVVDRVLPALALHPVLGFRVGPVVLHELGPALFLLGAHVASSSLLTTGHQSIRVVGLTTTPSMPFDLSIPP